MKYHSNPLLRSRGRDRLGNFINYFKDDGIVQQCTVPHTPQQNEVAERKNKTLVECARSMMKSKNISNYFWIEAISTVIYLNIRFQQGVLIIKLLSNPCIIINK
jgi:hypothetical protein